MTQVLVVSSGKSSNKFTALGAEVKEQKYSSLLSTETNEA
jgi:hypothetical protein